MSAPDLFALGGSRGGDDDRDLIVAAWRRYRDLEVQIRSITGKKHTDEQIAPFIREQGRLIEFINNTEPKTLADCIAKLQYLGDPDIGIDCGDRDDDAISVRQVCAFLELSIPHEGRIIWPELEARP